MTWQQNKSQRWWVFLTNFLDKQLLNRMIKIFSFFKHIQGTLGYSDYTINM